MISHATADDPTSGQTETAKPAYAQQAATPDYLRTLSEVRRFPGGSELARPGVSVFRGWQAVGRQETQATGYGSIGRDP